MSTDPMNTDLMNTDLMNTDLMTFNGIDGETGAYLLPPLPPETLASIALGEKWDPGHLEELKYRYECETQGNYAPIEGRDPKQLDQTGWGVVFAAGADPAINAAIREALTELLDLRRQQAGPLYKEYFGPEGYRPGETKDAFLARHGAGPGPVDPESVPYYLLLVGDPESIPYRFQYELDVQYAVGRIHFDTLDAYASYARSVLLAETPGMVQLPRQVTFVGVQNENDQATNLSAEYLIKPLAEKVLADQAGAAAAAPQPWQVQTWFKADASKARLQRLLGGGETPALLFTASHGVGFANGDARQLPFQGSLVCQDWPGRGNGISRDHYLAAEDIDDRARLLGMISFHFACYGAGTPYWDDFTEMAFKTRAPVAPHPFIAALPRRLLSHPKGGALAVVGHVERAWTYSFNWQHAPSQTTAFQSMLKRLQEGHPIGSALEYVNSRYAEISTALSNELDEARFSQRDPFTLAFLWTANKDARGYGIIGDPAVRLVAGTGNGPPVTRPEIEPVSLRPGSVPLVLVPDAALAGVAPALVAAAQPPADQPQAATVTAEQVPEAPAVPAPPELQEGLAQALRQLSATLTAYLQDMAEQEIITTIGAENAPNLQIRTHINRKGDIQTHLPAQIGEVDPGLLSIHAGMVEQAQAHRAVMLKTVTEALAILSKIAPK